MSRNSSSSLGLWQTGAQSPSKNICPGAAARTEMGSKEPFAFIPFGAEHQLMVSSSKIGMMTCTLNDSIKQEALGSLNKHRVFYMRWTN